MPRITPVQPADANGKAKQLLDAVQAKFGLTPNLIKTLATSPAALEGYLNFGAALAGGAFDAKFREQIALTVSQANSCEYCLAAHIAFGHVVGLEPDDITASRCARASDPKGEAGLVFAQAIVVNRGDVSDNAVKKVRAAGFTDGEITELVAHVAINIFSNYCNNVAQTVLDFPRVELSLATAARC